jgi:hypothetical protein
LGDYAAAGSPLVLFVKPPCDDEAPGTLGMDPLLPGLPHAAVPANSLFKTGSLTCVPGVEFWLLEARDADIHKIEQQMKPTLWRKTTVDGHDHYRLKPEVIEDIVMVCHYCVKPYV